jgi:hypothetical protein
LPLARALALRSHGHALAAKAGPFVEMKQSFETAHRNASGFVDARIR